MKYINHYTIGVNLVEHKGKIIATSLNSAYDDYIKNYDKLEYDVKYIPAGYEHRPDLISNIFFKSSTKDWYLMHLNNIKDPFQDLNVNDRILIPKK